MSAAHMGKRWFYQGFLRVSLIFLLPGPGGAGRAKGDMRFVVHLEMSILLVFTRFYNCFRGTRVLIPPRSRWRHGAPFVILLVFTRFLHVFPPGPRRLQKRMHFVAHQMAKPSPLAVI